MKVLSVRQPDAWLLVNGPKDIENRSRATHFRGEIAIHASAKAMTRDDWEYLREACEDYELPVPPADALPTGGIVGAVEILDCVTESESPWFFGPYGYVIGIYMPCTLIPCKGKLGFWEYPGEISDLEFGEPAIPLVETDDAQREP